MRSFTLLLSLALLAACASPGTTKPTQLHASKDGVWWEYSHMFWQDHDLEKSAEAHCKKFGKKARQVITYTKSIDRSVVEFECRR